MTKTENDNYFNEYKDMILSLIKLPKNITNEWIDNAFKDKTVIKNDKFNELIAFNELIDHFGISFQDLSKVDLSNIDCEHMLKLSFNTATKFPPQDRLPKGYCPSKIIEFSKSPMLGVEKLHEKGIDGSGVTVATIDFGFDRNNHIEFEDADIEVIDLFKDTETHYHAHGVLSNLCGKNIGLAPKCKVYHYNTYQGYGSEVDFATLEILKDILKKVESGEKIRVVNMSAPLLRNEALLAESDPKKWDKLKAEQSKPFLEIIEKLREKGCEVITSEVFSRDFSCCDIDYKTKKLSKPSWIITKKDFSETPCFIVAGKSIPQYSTQNDYKFETRSCYSWAIPQAVGLYCLCLQCNPNLKWDEFAQICKNTSIFTDDGVRLCQPVKVIEKIKEKDMLLSK